MADRVYLTKDGYEKLKNELNNLKNVERKNIAKQIKEAREQGDLSENAEYDAAKEKQGRLENRIKFLEDRLGRSVIMDSNDFDTSEIRIGVTAKLFDVNRKVELNYTFVDATEANFSDGKISITSPIGQGLLGHKEGEEIEINLPAKKLLIKILEIK